jgi:hypothetical protein
MWSGSSLHNKSGNLLGAHQKFDRTAAKFVHEIRSDNYFPTGKEVLHFEGHKGPDAIKRKSPGRDEPWHYWDPSDEEDTKLLKMVQNHYRSLVKALKNNDEEKSAFEAAWLSHAIVDGLTPAHHYPYEKKLMELRGGEAKETRNTKASKVIIKGDTKRQTISRTWGFWGAKGLYASHFIFEGGVSTISRPLKLKRAKPSNADVKHAKNVGLDAFMHEQVMDIYKLNMYERFLRTGWSPNLTKDVRLHLAPIIVKTIATVWTLAIDEAAE